MSEIFLSWIPGLTKTPQKFVWNHGSKGESWHLNQSLRKAVGTHYWINLPGRYYMFTL